MEEWRYYKLKDLLLIPIRNGLTKPSAIRGKGVKMIGMKEIFAMDIIKSIAMERVPVTDKELNSSEVLPNDLLFARQSLTLEGAGKCSIVSSVNEPTVFESHLIRVRIDEKKANPYYLYYYFKSKVGRTQIQALVQQVAAAGIRGKELIELEIKLPNISTQNRIVSILKSIDDKIEANRQINDNLEQQAQALFKSWFVDFEPFNDQLFIESELGMIPKGWRVVDLDDILELRKNNYKKGDDVSLPYLPIDIIPMHSLGVSEFKDNSEAQSSLQTFEKNDIVIGAMRVYFHRVIIAPCNGITRNTCFVLRPKHQDMWAYSILQCNQDEAIDYANRTSKGSTMPYAIWKNGFGGFKVILPHFDVLKCFNEKLSPILGKIRDSYKINTTLANMRDTLLPRLMSGEIEVKNIEQSL